MFERGPHAPIRVIDGYLPPFPFSRSFVPFRGQNSPRPRILRVPSLRLRAFA